MEDAVIVSRDDLVGNYLGETSIKTHKLLEDHAGKTIIVEPLVLNKNDVYGYEALSTLFKFVNDRPQCLTVVLL